MSRPRRKAAAQQAPATIEEATALLGRYRGKLDAAEQLRLDAAAAIAQIEAVRDEALAPIEEQAKAEFLQLRAWWAVAGETLTEGKRKSLELAGCVLGERTTPPSLKMPGNAAAAAATLVAAGLAELCRHKIEVDKPAVLKAIGVGEALDAVDAEALGPEERQEFEHVKLVFETVIELGFRPVRKEEFFIDRAGEKPAAVEEVALSEAAE